MRRICCVCEHIFDEHNNDCIQPTCDDCAAVMMEDWDDDGQPDELTEWMDFDPDC